jgi:hypothetical protein
VIGDGTVIDGAVSSAVVFEMSMLALWSTMPSSVLY